jgi:asparagine synthase (glutamine-hydrolysing)
MAHGLELRAPFLDVDLAEFCVSLPPFLKVDDESDKVLLRAAFADSWPEPVRNRTKQGFGAPVEAWLARPDMKELAAELLWNSHSKLFDHCDIAGTTDFLRRASPYQTWLLLNLAAWLQTLKASQTSLSTET